MTKDEVIAKAKESGLTLSDAEIDEAVKSGKMPEKKEDHIGTSVDALVTKYTPRQLAEMLIDTRSEAKDRRLENKELKANVETLTVEITKVKELALKSPELEKQLTSLNELLAKQKEGEKKRREAVMSKLEKEKQDALDYLLNVDNVTPDKFDATVSLFEKKSNGMSPPPSPGTPPKEYFTKEEVAAMSQSEVSANLEKINKSIATWK